MSKAKQPKPAATPEAPVGGPADDPVDTATTAAGEGQASEAASEPIGDPVATTGDTIVDPAAGPAIGAPASDEQPHPPHLRGALRVSAPGGERRRAGFAFGREPRTLTYADIVAAGLDPEAVVTSLLADPQLAVVPLP
ncbi:hypothetical protein [Prosthecomicrobium hirschii]|uniref:hypothetical protein n=1 Tax=Prosthecodimorpha hirschii TaxID=665126 RepID=UPI00221E3BFB|nr:hypothetical protein [Prosthecomicrobium hirschii]MCW1842295.1 hypothetical protein [Prosthecomicrobium hirschii]